jgi:HPt (histidine-containing phosphotransfer) domain-containing protein
MEVPHDMQIRYLENRKKDLERCLDFLESSNFSELEKVGHQLKGNGVTFGFAELSDIGFHLQVAANKRNLNELECVLKNFSFLVNQHLS